MKAFGARLRALGTSVPYVITAAALSAAVVFSAGGPALGQGASERIPAGPANMFKPGAAFLYYAGTADPARIEGLNAALNTMTAQSAETAAAMQAVRAGIDSGVADSSRDDLARTVATSIEGTFSVVVQAGFLQALSRTDPAFGRMLETAQMNIRLPDGEAVDLPVLLAAAVHSLSVVSAGERMRGESPSRDLAGSYELQTTGTCAVPDGTIEISQQDFVIEGVAGDMLTFFGAVGDGRIYVVSNEQRFARVTDNAGQTPQIDVPDQASDLFEAELPDGRGSITFRSIARGTCSFVLTPAS